MASAKQVVYENGTAIKEHMKNRQQANCVDRPQCVGQEDQPVIYANSAYLSRYKHEDGGKEQYVDMGAMNPGEKEEYVAMGAMNPGGREQYVAMNELNPGGKEEYVAMNELNPCGQPQRQYENLDTKLQAGTNFGDDVRHHSTGKWSEMKKKRASSGSGSKYADKKEIRNVNEIQKKADEIIKRDRQQGGKIWFYIYLVPVCLIMAVVALVLAVLLVAGVIKNNKCGCLAEINQLKQIQVAHLRAQHTSPASVSTLFRITPTTSRFTPSSPSASPVRDKTVLSASSSRSILLPTTRSILHTTLLVSAVSARNSRMSASTSVV